jgi:methionyl-tRNA synthetase
MRTTQHYLLRLGSFAIPLAEWLRTRVGWRRHVQNWALGMVAEGLPDRAITRDLDWGVPIPPEADTLGEGKRIYVWFEAVIGYLSASKEWAWRRGTPEAWRDWWQVPEAESYYFVGKDNIPFHTVIWPAMLMGYGGHNLPTDVPANQFITFRGEKGSASAGVGRSITWYTERFEPDSLRYALAAVLPEQNDTDLSDEEIVRRINEELVATWGNLVNRVLTIVERDFDGVLPSRTEEVPEDLELLDQIRAALTEAGSMIEAVELRAGLRRVMEAATATNAYLNAQAPWRLVGTDRQRAGTVLRTAVDAIAGLRVGFAPYLPFTSARLGPMLGLTEDTEAWAMPIVPDGAKIGPVAPLFTKIPDALLEEEA